MSHNDVPLCASLCVCHRFLPSPSSEHEGLYYFSICVDHKIALWLEEWERVRGAQAHVLHTAGRIKKAYPMRTTAAAAGRQHCCLFLMPPGGPWAWSQLHDALWQNIFIERIIFTLEGTARVCVSVCVGCACVCATLWFFLLGMCFIYACHLPLCLIKLY